MGNLNGNNIIDGFCCNDGEVVLFIRVRILIRPEQG